MQFISKDFRINFEIKAREIRMVDNDGNQIGVMSVRDALKMAEESDLDLVEVSPQAVPPVCRLMDYGKFKFEQDKKDKESRHKHKTFEVKEVKLRLKIDQHDYVTKNKMARRLLEEGNKVKVTIMFRGREMAYTSMGQKLLDRFALDLADIASIEKPSKVEGKNMIIIMTPKAPA